MAPKMIQVAPNLPFLKDGTSFEPSWFRELCSRSAGNIGRCWMPFRLNVTASVCRRFRCISCVAFARFCSVFATPSSRSASESSLSPPASPAADAPAPAPPLAAPAVRCCVAVPGTWAAGGRLHRGGNNSLLSFYSKRPRDSLRQRGTALNPGGRAHP